MEGMNRLSKSVNIMAVLALASTGIIAPAIAGSDITISQGSLKLAQASLAGQCRATKVQVPVFKAADVTSEAVRLLSPDEQVTLAGRSARANGFISISAPVTGFVQSFNLKPCSSGTATAPSPSSSSATLPSPTVGVATLPVPTVGTATAQAPSPSSSPTTTPSPSSSPTTTPSPSSSPTTTPRPSSSPTTTPRPSSSPTTTPSPSSSPTTPTNKDLCRRVVRPPQGLLIRREPNIKAPQVGKVAYLGQVTLTTNPPTTKTADERDWVEITSPVKGWISHSLLVETQSNLAYCE